jgi:hypothetical protein
MVAFNASSPTAAPSPSRARASRLRRSCRQWAAWVSPASEAAMVDRSPARLASCSAASRPADHERDAARYFTGSSSPSADLGRGELALRAEGLGVQGTGTFIVQQITEIPRAPGVASRASSPSSRASSSSTSWTVFGFSSRRRIASSAFGLLCLSASRMSRRGPAAEGAGRRSGGRELVTVRRDLAETEEELEEADEWLDVDLSAEGLGKLVRESLHRFLPWEVTALARVVNEGGRAPRPARGRDEQWRRAMRRILRQPERAHDAAAPRLAHLLRPGCWSWCRRPAAHTHTRGTARPPSPRSTTWPGAAAAAATAKSS